MRLCGLAQFPPYETTGADESEQPEFFLPSGQPGEALFGLCPYQFGTSDTTELPEMILKRLLCYALLQQLPDEALDEAVESLVHMKEFYRLPSPALPPLLPRESFTVRMGPGSVRPVFPVTEEE